MSYIFFRFFLNAVIATTVPFFSPTSVYGTELWKGWFNSEKEEPSKKLTVICPEISDLNLSTANLHTNIAAVSPTTFNYFFSKIGGDSGYLRVYDEYIKMKEEGDICIKSAKKIIFVKPSMGIPDNVIAMNESLRTILLRCCGKNPDTKKIDITFISVLGDFLDPINQIKVDLKIVPHESLKEKNIEIVSQTLEHQIRKKFQNIPITSAFNGLVFSFTHQELNHAPQILEISATLKGYSSSHAKIIDTSTQIVMSVDDKIKLDRYTQPPSLSFAHLIKTQERDIVKKSAPRRIPYGENSWKNSPKDFPSVVSLEEFLSTTDKRIIKEPCCPQLRNVNLNFKDLGIGGLDDQLHEIVRRSIKTRCVDKDVLELFDIKEHNKGIILFGPPGNGKTLIARKMAEMLGVPEKFFIVINGAEILSKYIGESEENLRKIFELAEQNPSQLVVIFFDEIDALASRRTNGTGAGDKVNNNLVNQLLTKMDGVKGINNILVIGATNRPDVLDPALMRPGRFGIQINIKLPDAEGRRDIFQIHLKHVLENGVLKDINMEQLVIKTQNFTGAEIKGICDEARSFALQDASDNPQDLSSVNREKLCITMDHFLQAFTVIHPMFGQDIPSLEGLFPDHSLSLASQNIVLNKLLYNLESFRPGKVYSFLIKGPNGSGKSALAGRLASKTKSYFDLTRVISAGITKKSFIDQLDQVWQDALNVDKSLIILDGLENLVKMLNLYKYDERAMISLNSLLNSQIKKQVVVLATMNEEGAELFKEINPILKWSVQTQLPSLNQEDMEEILKAKGIKEQNIIELLSGLSLSKVLDILSIENAGTYNLEEWKRRISLLS